MQQRPTDWFGVINWLVIIIGLNMVSIMAGSAFVPLYLATLLLNVILGSVGIYCEMKMPGRGWPNAMAISILIMLTPGGFFNLFPWPILPIFTKFSYLSTHINIAVGATITLLCGIIAAWSLVTCAMQFACWTDKATNRTWRYLLPLPLFSALLVLYHVIIAGILRTMCHWGLYSNMGGFHRIS